MHGQKPLTVVAALLSGMTLCYAATASAQEAPVFVYGDSSGAKSERVAFADLDLASATGKARLHNRVGAAIERVCDLELGRDGLSDLAPDTLGAFIGSTLGAASLWAVELPPHDDRRR